MPSTSDNEPIYQNEQMKPSNLHLNLKMFLQTSIETSNKPRNKYLRQAADSNAIQQTREAEFHVA